MPDAVVGHDEVEQAVALAPADVDVQRAVGRHPVLDRVLHDRLQDERGHLHVAHERRHVDDDVDPVAEARLLEQDVLAHVLELASEAG